MLNIINVKTNVRTDSPIFCELTKQNRSFFNNFMYKALSTKTKPSILVPETLSHHKYNIYPNRYILHYILYFNKLILAYVGYTYSESKDFLPRTLTFLSSYHRQKYNPSVTKATESPADEQRNKNPLLGAIGLRPLKCYLKMPALGFLQKQMKSLHRACIPGIINSFWVMLFKEVHSCIQNTFSSSVGLGTDMKPGASAGTYRQESI